DGAVRLRAYGSGTAVGTFAGPGAPLRAFAVSPRAGLLAAGTADGQLWLWGTADGKPLAHGPAHAGAVAGVALPPATGPLLTVGADGLLNVWKLPPARPAELPEPTKISAHAGGAVGVVYNANGTQAFTAGADGMVRLWDVAAGVARRTFG